MLLVFGLGYAAQAIARIASMPVVGTTRDGRGGTLRFDDETTVRSALSAATHILSSVPPDAAGDAVLARYGDALGGRWLGYLSSTGVYGDTRGAWVDETATADRGRRVSRNAADAAWLARDACVFRLPGIYGPGRSAFDRLREGRAHLTGIPDQVFSRVHVDDIASGVLAALYAPPGVYNLADDMPSSQDIVMRHAARMLGLPDPPMVAVTSLSPEARAFYAENRRVANAKAKRVLGWWPRYPDFAAGLRAILATEADGGTFTVPRSPPPTA